METSKKISTVLRSYLREGSLDKVDLRGLDPKERDLVHTLVDQGQVSEALDFLREHNTSGSWESLRAVMGRPRNKKRIWKGYVKYAAIFIGVGGLLYFAAKTMGANEAVPLQAPEGITLTSNAKGAILLGEEGNGDVVVDEDRLTVRQIGDTLEYVPAAGVSELVYDELYVPNGRTFNLRLSDGSVVHLNSGSRIKFPVAFLEQGPRQLYLDGEAYFKVAHDKARPFRVQVADMQVEVLGTEFDVANYAEDVTVRTVLVSGSVQVSTTSETLTMHPGELTSWDVTNQTLKTKKVNVQDYIGWLRGEMEFQSMTFASMKPKLERAYGVRITNTNPVLDQRRFNATFDRNIESIDDVLRVLAQVQKFSFRKDTEGNITID